LARPEKSRSSESDRIRERQQIMETSECALNSSDDTETMSNSHGAPDANVGTASGFIRGVDARNRVADIRMPDATGAFIGSALDALLSDIPVIVPDTNILRLDMDHSCGASERGILISAANTGTLRLICAEHVIREVEAQLEEWAAYQERPAATYVDRWRSEYRPQMRVVPTGGLSATMLTANERKRVTDLGPSKDVPSVILSRVLGAFYLTHDVAAWKAVYGPDADASQLKKIWYHDVGAGSDAGELNKFLTLTTALPVMIGGGIVQATKWAFAKAPWLVVAGALAAVGLAIRIPRERYGNVAEGALRILSFFSEEWYEPYHRALSAFRRREPELPTWEELSSTVADRRALLARACAYTLARAPGGPIGVQRIAGRLPFLHGVGQRAQLIRDVLRADSAFFSPHQNGTWQFGRPADRLR
jgi:hypothetical protein